MMHSTHPLFGFSTHSFLISCGKTANVCYNSVQVFKHISYASARSFQKLNFLPSRFTSSLLEFLAAVSPYSQILNISSVNWFSHLSKFKGDEQMVIKQETTNLLDLTRAFLYQPDADMA